MSIAVKKYWRIRQWFIMASSIHRRNVCMSVYWYFGFIPKLSNWPTIAFLAHQNLLHVGCSKNYENTLVMWVTMWTKVTKARSTVHPIKNRGRVWSRVVRATRSTGGRYVTPSSVVFPILAFITIESWIFLNQVSYTYL